MRQTLVFERCVPFDARRCLRVAAFALTLVALAACGDATGTDEIVCVDVLRSTAVTTPASLWTQLAPTGTPPAGRWHHGAAYDNAGDRLIVFGGRTASSAVNEVWVLSNASGAAGTPAWTQLTPTGAAPVARTEHVVAYDPASNRLIVYGGVNASNFIVSDLWALTNANGTGGTPAWTQLTPSGAPSARTGVAATYDAANNRLTISGGVVCNSGNCTLFNEAWVLTNASGTAGAPAFTKLNVLGGDIPATRYFASAAYDAAGNQMHLFGGIGADGFARADIWSLRSPNNLGMQPAWNQGFPVTSPPARYNHTTVFDGPRSRVVIFGGVGMDNVVRRDVWSYAPLSASWSPYAAASTPRPAARSRPTAVVSPTHNRMIVFGGNVGSSSYVNDVWSLRLDQPAPATVTIVSQATQVCAEKTLELVAVVKDATGVVLDQLVSWHSDNPGIPIRPDPANPHVGIIDPGTTVGAATIRACVPPGGATCVSLPITRVAGRGGPSALSFDGTYTATVMTDTPAGRTTGTGTFSVLNGNVSDPGKTFTGTVNSSGAFTGSSIVCQGCNPLPMTGTFSRTQTFTISGSSGSVSQTMSVRKTG